MVIFKYKIKVSFPILANLFRPFGFIAPKNYLAFLFFDLSVPDEGYSRNMSCTLNLISTFLFQMCLEINSKYLLLKERGSYSMKC